MGASTTDHIAQADHSTRFALLTFVLMVIAQTALFTSGVVALYQDRIAGRTLAGRVIATALQDTHSVSCETSGAER